MPPSSFLGVNKSLGSIDQPATQVELEHGINAGLFLESFSRGLVPNYEEQVARLERGISLEGWSKMGVDEKAMIIAVRRTTMAIKNIQAEAEIEESIAKTKKTRKV